MAKRSLSKSVTFREYLVSDFEVLAEMLKDEGIKHTAIAPRENKVTVIMEVDNKIAGFYAWGKISGSFYLYHFIIDKGFRGRCYWKKLLTHMLSTTGDTAWLVQVEESNIRLLRCIKFVSSFMCYFNSIEAKGIKNHMYFVKFKEV